jgi:hypothetical protein
MAYARLVESGAKSDARLYFFHRQASEGHDLTTRDGVRAAVVEASGPISEWSDIDGIAEQWDDPTADRAYLARVWLNMLVRGATSAFDAEQWKDLADEKLVPEDALITLGFDGSKTGDSTALVACEVTTGKLWPLGIWDPARHNGQIPEDLVDIAVDDAFARYRVVRFYADPPYWKDAVTRWAGRYGDKIVLKWETWRSRAMGYAVRNFASAISAGTLSHDGDTVLAQHIGAARRRDVNERDDKGERLWVIDKERPDSPFPIDGATASILAWEARNDAIATGVNEVVTWELV